MLNNTEIKRISNTKSLAVGVHENLHWEEQYKTAKNKIYGGLASLKKLENTLTQPKLGSVYCGSLPMRITEILQRLQHRTQSKSARLKDNWSCYWLNVYNLISFDQFVVTYKVMNKLSHESLWDKVEQRSAHQNMQQGTAMIFKSQDKIQNMQKRALTIKR